MNNAMKYVQVQRAIEPCLNLPQLHILFLFVQTQTKDKSPSILVSKMLLLPTSLPSYLPSLSILQQSRLVCRIHSLVQACVGGGVSLSISPSMSVGKLQHHCISLPDFITVSTIRLYIWCLTLPVPLYQMYTFIYQSIILNSRLDQIRITRVTLYGPESLCHVNMSM